MGAGLVGGKELSGAKMNGTVVDTREWLSNKANINQVKAILVYKLRPPKHDVEDLSQHVMCRMCSNDCLSKYDETMSSFRAYLYTCVVRFGMNFYKTKWARTERGDVSVRLNEDVISEDSWVESVDRAIDIDRMHAMIDKKMSTRRAGMVHLYLNGIKKSDIASSMGVSRQAVELAVGTFFERIGMAKPQFRGPGKKGSKHVKAQGI